MGRPIDGEDLAGKLRTRYALEGDRNVKEVLALVIGDTEQAKRLTLNDLRDAIYDDALAHGLWEGTEAIESAPDLHDACIDLIAAEVCEMGEAWTDWDKFVEELADVIIVSMSVAGRLGVDIDTAVRRKMEINKTRAWKHEGEA